MELWMKIAWGIALLMMLPYAYRGFKYWVQHGPKPQPGDWQSAIFALGIVMLFVLLLIMSVQ